MEGMKFQDCFRIECSTHPLMLPQDAVKFAYQSAFGAEHMLGDIEAAATAFFSEYAQVKKKAQEALFSELDETTLRLNLAAWKSRGYPEEELLELFLRSASPHPDGQILFEERLREITRFSQTGSLPFSQEDWLSFLRDYTQTPSHPLHHSKRYENAYAPHYRLVAISGLQMTLLSLGAQL